jgi:hypothetical protein
MTKPSTEETDGEASLRGQAARRDAFSASALSPGKDRLVTCVSLGAEPVAKSEIISGLPTPGCAPDGKDHDLMGRATRRVFRGDTAPPGDTPDPDGPYPPIETEMAR